MRRFGWLGSLIAAIALTVHPGAARADSLLNTLVQLVPPLLLSNAQPAAPADGYIWQPGYWAWSPNGTYYWVPGEWVLPPQTGYVWTPGYWAYTGNGYAWNPGYWANQVGYYGGVDYGDGYYGNGYVGGRWYGNTYRYNRAVTHVNVHIRNVYEDRTVVVNRRVWTSYNGGRGIDTRPTAWQRTFAHEHHRGPTDVQVRHETEAARDPHLRWNGNGAQHLPAVHHETHPPVVHQQSHPPVVHQQSHLPVVHQQSHPPVVHQPMHPPVIHQQSQHQPAVHQERHQPAVRQPARPAHAERAPHPHSSGHPG